MSALGARTKQALLFGGGSLRRVYIDKVKDSMGTEGRKLRKVLAVCYTVDQTKYLLGYLQSIAVLLASEASFSRSSVKTNTKTNPFLMYRRCSSRLMVGSGARLSLACTPSDPNSLYSLFKINPC